MNRTKSLLLVVSSFILLCTYAKADDDILDNDSIIMSYTAKEVVIESFKQNDHLSTKPIAGVLISNKTIKDRNITSIKDVTGLVPNLYIPDYGSKMTSPAYIRGIGSRINAPSVGLYVDGIPYFDRSAFDFNINDLERIEILRGPQGTIYGRNTMGGVINVYTKSPLKYKETNVTVSGATYNTYKAELSHYNKITNSLGYSIAGSYHHTGGYFENIYTGKKADPMDEVSARLRLSWRVNTHWFMHLISAYEYSDQGGYAYGLYNDSTNKVNPVNYNEPSFYRRNMSSNGINTEYISSNFKLSSQTSFQYFDGKQGIDQDFSPKDIYYVDFYQRQQMYSQEFNIKSINDNRYQWVFGLFGFHQNYKTSNDVNDRAVIPQTHKIQNISTPSTGIAAYHQSTIQDLLTNGLSLILGVRYDWEQVRLKSQRLEQSGSQPITPSAEIKDKSQFSQFTPKASLQYTFTNDEIVYFSVAKGYKVGGFNTTVENNNDRSFKPEYSWSYEIGAKASCLDKLIYTDIALFYIDWKNQQISQNIPGGKGYMLRNAGRSESKGVEATIHINPIRDLSIHLNSGYTYAKFKKYINDSLSYSNKFLPMVPRNTFSISADYSLRFKNTSWLDRITMNGQYAGLGSIYWKEDNIAKQSFYGTLSGKIAFIKGFTSIDLWAKNITNENYVSYFFSASGKNYAQKGKPFTCGINLNFKF